MTERIYRWPTAFHAPDGASYRVDICGEPQADGTWKGWLEFTPLAAIGPVIITDRETMADGRVGLEAWVEGMGVAFLEVAFARAARLRPT